MEKNNILTGWGPQDSVQLPCKWLRMVDITIVFMGVISWFINQQTYLGGPHPVEKLVHFFIISSPLDPPHHTTSRSTNAATGTVLVSRQPNGEHLPTTCKNRRCGSPESLPNDIVIVCVCMSKSLYIYI